ncbi:MAG: nucleotidyltransferase family protein [Bacteroidales bacterium]|nr:nucleotidyltransferase family protein [Bacteroidales bacterium]
MKADSVATVTLSRLLSAALWGDTACDFGHLGRDEWPAVFDLAVRQTVAGVCFEGLSAVPDTLMPDMGMLARWGANAAMIERRNREMNSALASVCSRLNAAGIIPVVLKGQTVAQYYPEPLMRECGDIDLYFPRTGDMSRCVELLSESCGKVELMPDGSYLTRCNGEIVEIHPSMFDMQPRRVRHLIDGLGSDCFEPYAIAGSQSVSAMMPVPSVNILMLNLHILRHALCFGIGLRQICDLAVAYSKIQGMPEEISALQHLYKDAGLTRWNNLLHSFMCDYLGMTADLVPGSFSHIDSRPLASIVFGGGNFGLHTRKGSKLSDTFNVVLRNNLRLLPYTPRHSASTLWQLITRSLNR